MGRWSPPAIGGGGLPQKEKKIEEEISGFEKCILVDSRDGFVMDNHGESTYYYFFIFQELNGTSKSTHKLTGSN